MAYDYDLFVIGGGSGGVRCGRIAAGHGARVAVAEERFWGGTCVNVGCVPKKLFVQAAEYGAWAEDSHGFGWDTRRGAHDWDRLVAAKDHEVARLNAAYRRLLVEAGADIIDARARFLDAHTLEVGGRRVTAERIVIAVGGRPIRPEIPGAELGIVSDDAFHLARFPRRVTLLGGGYIAVEFANIFRGLWAEVDLVYRQPLPLRGFDGELRQALAEAYEAQGTRLHPNTSIASLRAEGTARVATLDTGEEVRSDLVFFATGRLPNTAGLGLEAAGVRTDGFGAVCVDGALRTSQEHIHALGDVTNRMNLTPVATAEGHALADRLFGGVARESDFDNVPTAVFSSPPLGAVGLTEETAVLRGAVDIYTARFTPMRHAVSGRRRRTLMKLVVDQQSRRVIGVHMIGDDAPEIIQGMAVAMVAGATKADFDRTLGIHPTSAEEFVTMRMRTRGTGVPAAPD